MHTSKLVWLVCICFSFLQVKATHQPPKKFSLQLVVLDSTAQTPLEGASISIPQYHYYTTTNQSGLASIDSLSKGWITIQCSFVGYHPTQRQVYIDNDLRVSILLCASSTHLHEVQVISHHDESGDLGIRSRSMLNEQWMARNMGNNLAEQLASINGVSILNSGPNISKPVIRGLHSNRLVTLNNGIRQEGQQWGADHGTEIDPFASNRIEVIKGASSVEYGAEAIGGVIRLLPRDFKTTAGVNASVFLNAATNNGLVSGSTLLEGHHGILHQWSWRAQASYRKAGDSRSATYVLSNTAFEEWSSNYALHYQYKKFHAELSQSYYSTTLGILRAAHIGNSTDLMNALKRGEPTYIAPFTYKIDKPNQEVTHVVTAVKAYYPLTKHVRISAQWSQQQNSRKEYDRPPRWATSQLNNPTPQYDLQLNTNLVETKLEHSKWNNLRGAMGASWMNQGNVSVGLQPIIPNFRAYTYGVYVIEKWNYKKWNAEAGVRYDWRDQTTFEWKNNQVIQTAKNYHNGTFSLGSSYWLNEAWKIQGNWSSAWRAPSMNELYSNGLHGGTATYEIGNAQLNPERSVNKEISIQATKRKWQSELSYFHNSISNFIYKTPLPQPILTVRGAFPQFAFVQHDVVLQGVEWSNTFQLKKHWNAGLSANYLHAENKSLHEPLLFMPANRIRSHIGYENAKFSKLHDLFIQLQFTYVAKQNRYPQGVDYTSPPPAYSLVDFNLGFETHWGKQHLNWSISIYNVFNTAYRDYLSRFRYFVNDTGRNLVVRLSIPFTIYQPKKQQQH